MRLLFLTLLAILANLFNKIEADEVQAAENLQKMDYGSDFLRMAVVLIILVGFAIFSAWFIKKILKSRMHHINQSKGIKILEKRTLSPKSCLYLINVLGKGVVIAETPHGIHPITELNMDAETELLFSTETMDKKSRFSFQEMLSKKLKTHLTQK